MDATNQMVQPSLIHYRGLLGEMNKNGGEDGLYAKKENPLRAQ